MAINKEFHYSFQQLYSCEIRVTNSDLDSVCDGLNLPQLIEKQINFFDFLIALNELYDALKQMTHGKSPDHQMASLLSLSYVLGIIWSSLIGYVPASHQRRKSS